MRGHKSLSGTTPIEELLMRDEFADHKWLFELHSAAWLVAHHRGDEEVLLKSARQMLYHLQRMYSLTNVKTNLSPLRRRSSSYSGFVRLCSSL